MSDTPRTDAMQGHPRIAHVPVHFARELERELARVTEERDTERQTKEAAGRELIEAASQMRSLRADLAQRTAERDALAAEVAALKAERDPLAEMWRELSEYQEQAARDGHGESWAKMCSERTQAAAWVAKRYATRPAARDAADCAASAAWAAARHAESAGDAIAAIREDKEAKP